MDKFYWITIFGANKHYDKEYYHREITIEEVKKAIETTVSKYHNHG